MNRLRWTPEVPRWAIGISVATVMGAGALVGCGDDGETNQEEPAPPVVVEQGTELFDVEIQFQDGFMTTDIINPIGDDAAIFSFCQGHDIVEYLDSDRAAGESRTENHSACADGRLTPEDFPSAEVIAATTTTSVPG